MTWAVSPAADTPRTRLSTRLSFWVAGFGVSSWAPLVPGVQKRLAVSEGALGLLLLSLGMGSVVAMLRSGALCARHGCRPVILCAQFAIVLILPLLAMAYSPWQLALALFGFGAALGTLDVAVNVQAVEVERAAGRLLMSGFHGLFSVGACMGAASMTAFLSLSLSPLVSALLCAGLLLLAATASGPGLLRSTHSVMSARLVLPHGAVLWLAVLAAVAFLVEGAIMDWSALLLSARALTEAAQAGVGYAAFAAAMTIGRLSGDAVTARFGARTVMFWGGALAIAGFACALLAPWLVLSLLGFVLIGLGASNVVPILFRQAGAQRSMPATLAVSAITTAGYAGGLVGPALVGFVSQMIGLNGAFWGLALLMGAVPLFATMDCDDGRSG
jgi:MFS family permease